MLCFDFLNYVYGVFAFQKYFFLFLCSQTFQFFPLLFLCFTLYFQRLSPLQDWENSPPESVVLFIYFKLFNPSGIYIV